MNYWEKLKQLKISSQERRRDRYMILFLWKISQGLVKGYSVEFTSEHGRRGRVALPHNVVQSSPAMVRRARESSLGVKGAKMFNLLPPIVRNINSVNVEEFKTALDRPTYCVAGLGRAAESNCLLYQIVCLQFCNKDKDKDLTRCDADIYLSFCLIKKSVRLYPIVFTLKCVFISWKFKKVSLQ